MNKIFTQKMFAPYILLLVLNSCLDNKFDRKYYEKVTKIEFPNDYKVLQTFDNGEWLTGTVLELDSATLNNFVLQYKFDTVKQSEHLRLLLGSYWKQTYRPNILSNNTWLYMRGTKNKVFWTFVADIKENRLWIEISYPDWGGT